VEILSTTQFGNALSTRLTSNELKIGYTKNNCIYFVWERNVSPRLRQEHKLQLRFQVLSAASIKMAVFWVVAPCSLV
jgi:hypothetical protein